MGFETYLSYTQGKCILFIRLFWAFICILGAILGMYLIWQVRNKYVENPTITTIATTNYPIGKIQFPAVTICSNNKIHANTWETHIDSVLNDPNGR